MTPNSIGPDYNLYSVTVSNGAPYDGPDGEGSGNVKGGYTVEAEY